MSWGRFGNSLPHRVRIGIWADMVKSLLFSSLTVPYSSAVLCARGALAAQDSGDRRPPRLHCGRGKAGWRPQAGTSQSGGSERSYRIPPRSGRGQV